jgi:hypothetical protein
MPKQKAKPQNGQQEENQTYEQELTALLQERIKPGLNSGAIPLLARSIAKDIARRAPEEPAADEELEEPEAEEDVDEDEELEDEPEAEGDDEELEDEDEELEDEPEAEADEEELEDEDEEVEDEPEAEADDEELDDEEVEDEEVEDEEADDEEVDDEEAEPDLLTELQDLQAELGDDWIVRFSIQGEDSWMTAETEDGTQHLEAADATLLAEAVSLLNGGEEEPE